MSSTCHDLHVFFSELPRVRFPFSAGSIPRDGIYVLFESGEVGHGTDRIVRIGTHTGDHQLRSRLEQHFIRENKDRSVFRKNIGRALLSRDADPFLRQWELDLTSRENKQRFGILVDQVKLRTTEAQVTEYMQTNFSFVVCGVHDKALRLVLESRIIATISHCEVCRPSPTWLGLHSPKEKIRKSGLWQVNELYKQPLSVDEFELLRTMGCGI